MHCCGTRLMDNKLTAVKVSSQTSSFHRSTEQRQVENIFQSLQACGECIWEETLAEEKIFFHHNKIYLTKRIWKREREIKVCGAVTMRRSWYLWNIIPCFVASESLKKVTTAAKGGQMRVWPKAMPLGHDVSMQMVDSWPPCSESFLSTCTVFSPRGEVPTGHHAVMCKQGHKEHVRN